MINPISNMFSQTSKKIRTYDILIKRNSEEFNASSFKTHMDSPCSRMIVRKVLKDSSNSKEYSFLKRKYKKSTFRVGGQTKKIIFKKE